MTAFGAHMFLFVVKETSLSLIQFLWQKKKQQTEKYFGRYKSVNLTKQPQWGCPIPTPKRVKPKSTNRFQNLPKRTQNRVGLSDL